MLFAEKLKSLRTEKELTQEDIAQAIHVSKRTYIEYETGRSEPKLSTLKAIAETFCVTISELLSEPIKYNDHAEWFIISCLRQMENEEKEVMTKISEALLMKSRNTKIAKEAQKASITFDSDLSELNEEEKRFLHNPESNSDWMPNSGSHKDNEDSK